MRLPEPLALHARSFFSISPAVQTLEMKLGQNSLSELHIAIRFTSEWNLIKRHVAGLIGFREHIALHFAFVGHKSDLGMRYIINK